MITLRNDRNRDVMFCFLILYFPNHKIITVSNGSFRKTTSLILSIISLSSIQSASSILHLILFIHSLFKSQTTNITASSQITHYSISLFLSNTRLILTFLFITSLTFFHFFSKRATLTRDRTDFGGFIFS